VARALDPDQPKFYNPQVFKDENEAMVSFGVGKNMVRSMKFWAETTQIAQPVETGVYELTEFGKLLLGHEGLDQYLQEEKTLWLLHWKISTNRTSPVFFWRYLLNNLHRPDFTQSEAVEAFKRELERLSGNSTSENTLAAGWRIFLNTYFPTRGRRGEISEDNLDSPLIELNLLRRVGSRAVGNTSAKEDVFTFQIDDKPGVSPELLVYCLHDFWNSFHPAEETLSFKEICFGECSPGQVLKLPEAILAHRLESLNEDSSGVYDYRESASIQQATRLRKVTDEELIIKIYTV
jgi:hypothetical protein